jgi:hypothetical protein
VCHHQLPVSFAHPLSVTEVERMDVKFCATSYSGETDLAIYIWICGVVNSTVLCSFAVVQFVRHALGTRKVLGKWQPNRYMKFLVQESIFYFIGYVCSQATESSL